MPLLQARDAVLVQFASRQGDSDLVYIDAEFICRNTVSIFSPNLLLEADGATLLVAQNASLELPVQKINQTVVGQGDEGRGGIGPSVFRSDVGRCDVKPYFFPKKIRNLLRCKAEWKAEAHDYDFSANDVRHGSFCPHLPRI